MFPAPPSPLGDHTAPRDGGAPLVPHAWRLLPACPPREPYTAGLRAACLHLSGPWAGKKHQHKHFSTAGVHEVVASCSGKSRDQESRSDKPPWGHQSSPRHFVTARQPSWAREGYWPDGVSTLPCCSHIPRDALPASYKTRVCPKG